MGTEHGAAIGVWQLLVMAMPVVFVLFYFVPTIAVLRTRIGKRTRRLGFILWTLVGFLVGSAIGISPVLLIKGLGLSKPDATGDFFPVYDGLLLLALVVGSVLAYLYFRQLARRTYDAGLERWVAYMAALNPVALPFVIVFLFFRSSRRTAQPHLLV